MFNVHAHAGVFPDVFAPLEPAILVTAAQNTVSELSDCRSAGSAAAANLFVEWAGRADDDSRLRRAFVHPVRRVAFRCPLSHSVKPRQNAGFKRQRLVSRGDADPVITQAGVSRARLDGHLFGYVAFWLVCPLTIRGNASENGYPRLPENPGTVFVLEPIPVFGIDVGVDGHIKSFPRSRPKRTTDKSNSHL